MGIPVFPLRPGARVGVALAMACVMPPLVQAQQATNDLSIPSVPTDRVARTQSVTVTADLLTGFGNITLPVGYALDGAGIGRSVQSPSRSSLYYGSSISYQVSRALQFDVSYSKGKSSGDFTFQPEQGAGGRWPDASIKSKFNLDDTWLQGYARYKINWLSGARLSAYVRAGGGYVSANYDGTSLPGQSYYVTEGTIRDYTGNIGLGLDYRLHTFGENLFTRAVFEGEAFGGVRSRDFSETTIPISGSNKMDNMIFGGLGRLLLRAEYRFGSKLQWRASLEGGAQGRWTMESYSQPSRALTGYTKESIKSQSEILWGPYARVGLRYSF